jgi:hypothetical protein
MDDDDYYPPERVSHAVERLMGNPTALCAGSSEMYIYFKHIHKMYQFGPYGPNHATAATFAFRRELLKTTSYEETASLAEEKHFLKNYTIPFAQLNPLKTILVFSHIHNTFDKKILLTQNHDNNPFMKQSDKTIDNFVKQASIKQFFLDEIDEKLNNYDFGLPEKKPDVIKQIKEINENRARDEKNMMEQKLQEQHHVIQQLYNENIQLKEKIAYFEKKIGELIAAKIQEKKAIDAKTA